MLFPVDYLRSIEAVVPGTRGRVLAALANDLAQQSVRQVALRAGVSPSRAGQVLDDLAALGMVERRATRSHVAVRLVPENVAARWVMGLAEVWRSALEEMRLSAEAIRPAPLSLIVFGSFARGAAQTGSDVDVLAVHGDDVDEESDPATSARWVQTLGEWVDAAGRIAGNPVNVIDLDLDDLHHSAGERRRAVQEPAWLASAAREGVVLVGRPVGELMGGLVLRRGR